MENSVPKLAAEKSEIRIAHWLALGAVAGQVLFTLAWLFLGLVSPGFAMFGIVIEPYSSISTPISGLGLGLTGPYMNAAFVLSALLTFVGVLGIFHSIPELSPTARWSCIALFALSPIGMAMDGIFTLETFMPHMIGFLLGTGSLVAACLVAGFLLRRISSWSHFGKWLIFSSPLTLALLVLSLGTFDQSAVMVGSGIAGLTERILCIEIGACFAAFGWSAFRHS